MVGLSIAVCNKSAKILLARQFQSMSKYELEEHIIHFTRNIELCKESNHIETSSARYIFIPVEQLYLVYITPKFSNIIEDVEVLKTIYRLLQELCEGGIQDYLILENASEIILGIDDIVSMGYRENATISQITQFLKMDSQDEKAFLIAQKQKEQECKEKMNIHMKNVEKQRRENAFISDSVSSVNFDNTLSPGITSPEPLVEEEYKPVKPLFSQTNKLTKGLQLGQKHKKVLFEDQKNSQKIEEKLEEEASEKQSEFFDPLQNQVKIEVVEKLKGQINKDGEFNKLDIKGELFLTVLNPQKQKCLVQLQAPNLKYQTCFLDKKQWNGSKILVSDKQDGFPAKSRLCVLKYSHKLTEDDMPFTFACFSSSSGKYNLITFTVEFAEQSTFKEVNEVTFLLSHSSSNFSATATHSEYSYSEDNELIVWKIKDLHEGESHSLEVKTDETEKVFYPINVCFNLPQSVLPFEVKQVGDSETNEDILFEFTTQALANEGDFKIVFE